MRYWGLLIVSVIALGGCSTAARAPISPLTRAAPPVAQAAAAPHGATYVVQQGDTLYSIALAHDLDYRQLARWNKLASPGLIEVGQVLRLTPPSGSNAGTVAQGANSPAPASAGSGVTVTPLASAPPPQGLAVGQGQAIAQGQTAGQGQTEGQGAAAENTTPGALPVISSPVVSRLAYSPDNWNAVRQGMGAVPPPAASAAQGAPAAVGAPASGAATAPGGAAQNGPLQWQWPAQGNIVERFGENGSKGIDIAGTSGSPVVAVAPGKVVYSGSGLRGYGLLIIIRHADDYLSAYAHNEKAMVKEGQVVQAGQVIALMGDTDAKRVELHFEIRRFGKALDPMKLLPPRS